MQDAVNLRALEADIVRLDHGRVIVVAGVLAFVCNGVHRPELHAMLAERRHESEMIAVHVGDPTRVNLLQAEMFLRVSDDALQDDRWKEAAIEEQSVPAIR